MKNQIKISKNITLILVFIFSGVLFSHNAFASDTYASIANNGVIWSTVDILPSTTMPTGALFTVTGQLISQSSTSEVVNLTANNDGNGEVPLVPLTAGTITLGSNLSTSLNSKTFTAPGNLGNYNVNFTTYVDIIPLSCIPSNIFTFVPMGIRWGKITTAASAALPETITVNLYGDALGNVPPSQLTGTVTFDIPNQPNRHSYHNGIDCDAYGCEIAGPAGYDHGAIQNNICPGATNISARVGAAGPSGICNMPWDVYFVAPPATGFQQGAKVFYDSGLNNPVVEDLISDPNGTIYDLIGNVIGPPTGDTC